MPWKIAEGRERDQWARVRGSRCATRSRLSRFLLLGSLVGSPAIAQSPTYGVGRTPTAEELRRMDISIGPTGEELPPGRGTAKEGAQVYLTEGVHRLPWRSGPWGIGARVAIETRRGCSRLEKGAHPATALAVCDDGVGFHQSRHATRAGGDLSPMRSTR